MARVVSARLGKKRRGSPLSRDEILSAIVQSHHAAAKIVFPSRSAKNGSGFGGGLANSDITDLIYVHGFDIPIEQPETSAAVERRLAETARKLDRRLHVVRTDLRDLLDPSISWEIAHGAALASVALLFEPRCGRVLIGAGMSYGNLFNRGSHPLLDHLWSTERCRIEHHGAHMTRAAKIRQIAASQEALSNDAFFPLLAADPANSGCRGSGAAAQPPWIRPRIASRRDDAPERRVRARVVAVASRPRS